MEERWKNRPSNSPLELAPLLPCPWEGIYERIPYSLFCLFTILLNHTSIHVHVGHEEYMFFVFSYNFVLLVIAAQSFLWCSSFSCISTSSCTSLASQLFEVLSSILFVCPTLHCPLVLSLEADEKKTKMRREGGKILSSIQDRSVNRSTTPFFTS